MNKQLIKILQHSLMKRYRVCTTDECFMFAYNYGHNKCDIQTWNLLSWYEPASSFNKMLLSRKLTKCADEEVSNINIHECWLWFSSLAISWIHIHSSAYFRFHLQTLTLVEPATLSCSYSHTGTPTQTYAHSLTHTFYKNKMVIMIMEISGVGTHTAHCEHWAANIWWKRSIYISCVFPPYSSTGVNKNGICSNIIYILFIGTHIDTCSSSTYTLSLSQRVRLLHNRAA